MLLKTNQEMEYVLSYQNDSKKLLSLFRISKARELVEKLTAELESNKKLLELAEADYVNTVTHEVDYYDYTIFIESANQYFYASEKVDKRSSEYKSNKYAFNRLQDDLRKWLSCPDIKIIGFCAGGMEGYYEEIVFVTGSGRKYGIMFPVTKNVSVNNFNFAYECKIALAEYEPSVCNIIEKSYDIEDIKKAFSERLSGGND